MSQHQIEAAHDGLMTAQGLPTYATLRRQRDLLAKAARLLSVAWEMKPPLAWQPDGHQSLLAGLRRALAAVEKMKEGSRDANN